MCINFDFLFNKTVTRTRQTLYLLNTRNNPGGGGFGQVYTSLYRVNHHNRSACDSDVRAHERIPLPHNSALLTRGEITISQ